MTCDSSRSKNTRYPDFASDNAASGLASAKASDASIFATTIWQALKWHQRKKAWTSSLRQELVGRRYTTHLGSQDKLLAKRAKARLVEYHLVVHRTTLHLKETAPVIISVLLSFWLEAQFPDDHDCH